MQNRGRGKMDKFLFKDGTSIYTIEEGQRVKIGEEPLTNEMFVFRGLNDLTPINSSHFVGLSYPKILHRSL
jgi:hypothetical protein